MKRLAAVVMTATVTASLVATMDATAAGCQVQQAEIPVRIVDHRPIATLTLNGVETPMLVDSGAFFSFLSPATATQLDLRLRSLPAGLRIEGYTGRVESRLTRVDKVGLLGAELKDVEFIVGGNDLNAGIMGILGRNVLAAGDTEYDLAHGVVRLSFPKGDCDNTDFAHWAGKAPVVEVPLDRALNGADTAIRVSVSINGERALALLDTGAPQTAITLKTARRAGIADADLEPYGRVGGAGEGRVNAWTARVAAFELGGEKIVNNRLQVDDNGRAQQDLLVGLDYFLSHHIYVSRLQRKVYVTWNGGPVFALAREAPGEYDARYAAAPQELAAEDADGLARRGAAAIAAGDLDRALDDLDRARALAPDVADYAFDRARLHLRMGRPQLALVDLDATLRLAPTLAEPRFRRAALREALGDHPGAQADLAQLDAALPPSAPLRAAMAQFYARPGIDKVPEAMKQYDLWFTSHPRDARRAELLNSRCWLRARLNMDLKLALQDCEDAIDVDDGAAASRDSLGWVWLRMGDPAKARKAFDGAIKLEALPFSLYGRAVAQRRLKEVAASDRDLAAARKLRPTIDDEVRQLGFDVTGDIAPPPVVAGS